MLSLIAASQAFVATGPTPAATVARSGSLVMSLDKYREELRATAQHLASPGKGILAVDESTKTIGKRLNSIGVENSESARQDYRGLLFTCPGLGQYISGAILYEETLFQDHKDGTSFVDCLKPRGIIPGIKVDTGLVPLPGADGIETVCTGLDGLLERAQKFYDQGARFAKWRTVLQISDKTPTDVCLQEAAWGLARYARTVQEAGLVPIVEPEILMDGEHDIERTAELQERVLSTVYSALHTNGVFLEGSILKPSMTTQGANSDIPFDSDQIAKYTIRTLERTVPSAVAGITFLSGGQSEEEASLNINAMNSVERKGSWQLSFSFGRALQQSCLKAWKGKEENVEAAQKALLARAQANGEAALGKYVAGSQPSADEALFVAGYKY